MNTTPIKPFLLEDNNKTMHYNGEKQTLFYSAQAQLEYFARNRNYLNFSRKPLLILNHVCPIPSDPWFVQLEHRATDPSAHKLPLRSSECWFAISFTLHSMHLRNKKSPRPTRKHKRIMQIWEIIGWKK